MGTSRRAPTVNIAAVPILTPSSSPSKPWKRLLNKSKGCVSIVSSIIGDTPERIQIAATPEDRYAKGSAEGMVVAINSSPEHAKGENVECLVRVRRLQGEDDLAREAGKGQDNEPFAIENPIPTTLFAALVPEHS